MGLGKPGKNKTMALKIVDEEYDFFDDELSRAKGLFTRQLKKFLKNAKVKGKDGAPKKSNSNTKKDPND